ncbi:hypothetical protein G5V57_23950 [Nordella sp. HKS 07]|uniref:hypothetical protein n=1 Tax=Nordella sp. HKS 07 TaxID=2712222 RepID=UPI0013E13D4B|nr:hypothetical protein [Nordella sp. HKS 07]QIG50511.1 hypothetical protein G5V57_23950 [Nordella sp. HKS 07]
MKLVFITALIGITLAAATPMRAADTTIEAMPPKLELQLALSAAPPLLRDRATVHLLDPKTGYKLAKQGTNGVTCIVERTQWELANFRNDIYVPLCYDAEGTKTYLSYIMDTATLRAQGMGPAELKAEVEKRFRDKTYKVPEKPGLSYMVAPIMRTLGPPDLKVRTMAMPHLMFYAPYLTNAEIGAAPDFADFDSLVYPFVDRQGNPEHSYMIQLIGQAEKAKILSNEKQLLADLCAYRDVLCLDHMEH